MGATQSTPGFGLPPSSSGADQPHLSNNQHTVAALLAYNLAQAQHVPAAHRTPADGGAPPPGCPMHKADSTASPPSPPPSKPRSKPVLPASSAGQCPIPHDQRDAYLAERSAASSSSSSSSGSPWSSKLNPLNMMPDLSQTATPQQETQLSTERTLSSIPRSRISPAPGASPYDAPSACPIPHDARGTSSSPSPSPAAAAAAAGAPASAADDERDTKWEYPSPQQFYNALVRKGWETPEEHVETMVLIHNFLNEQAWLEVLAWEARAGADASRAELARFQGRPGTLSPKARLFGLLATLAPSRFSEEPPFDRHDWIVRRPDQGGREVRYVIDYYSVPDDPTKEEPEFVLDVRPALDSFESLRVRARTAFSEWMEGEGEAKAKGEAGK